MTSLRRRMTEDMQVRCQTQNYLRIVQRYLRMTQNPLSLHVVCCRIDGAAPQGNWVLQLRSPLRSNCFLAVLFDGVADATDWPGGTE